MIRDSSHSDGRPAASMLRSAPGGRDTMAWWRRTKVETEPETASSTGFPLIRLEGITKIFKGDADEETHALSDVTLDIDRGEYISVSGPSGCGKSTFLSILALL